MGIPFTLSVLDHHRSYIAVLDLLPDIYVQLWLFSLATQRRQETECSGMWWSILLYFHCDALERVCRWHAVPKMIRCAQDDCKGRNRRCCVWHHCYCLLSTFRLEMKVIKGSGGIPQLSYTGRDDRHFVPTGLYIVRTVNGRKRESLVLILLFSVSPSKK